MYSLGISCHYHDSAAALARDGRVVAAVGEERLSRAKSDDRFPSGAIKYCTEEQGVPMADLDLVAFYEKPLLKFERLLDGYMSFAPRGLRSFVDVVPKWLGGRLWIKSRIRKAGYRGPVLFADHHMSHAAHSFFTSGFAEAAVLTVDGVGEWATAAFGSASGDGIDLGYEIRYPHSVGLFYSAITQFLGFGINEGEYKVMGLAPYGRPSRYELMTERLMDVRSDGSLRLNEKYFEFVGSKSMTGRAMSDLLGAPPRAPGGPILEAHRDIAASAQKALEEVVLRMARHVHERTGMSRLCLGGGVALNGVANARILKEGPFEAVHVPVSPGDGGSAAGCAQWCAPRGHADSGPYLGPSFSDGRVLEFLRGAGGEGLRYSECTAGEAARMVSDGLVVGWFQGRSEYGPRALGNRSVIADPRRAETKDVINSRVKGREEFRPFAPSVMEEHAAKYFDLDGPSPHMSMVVRVLRPDAIPAVTHVDGTARVQTVSPGQNRAFYSLISEFYEITGVPVVLNTSMNVAGEPIVNGPGEACAMLKGTGMDALVMGRFAVRRAGDA